MKSSQHGWMLPEEGKTFACETVSQFLRMEVQLYAKSGGDLMRMHPVPWLPTGGCDLLAFFSRRSVWCYRWPWDNETSNNRCKTTTSKLPSWQTQVVMLALMMLFQSLMGMTGGSALVLAGFLTSQLRKFMLMEWNIKCNIQQTVQVHFPSKVVKINVSRCCKKKQKLLEDSSPPSRHVHDGACDGCRSLSWWDFLLLERGISRWAETMKHCRQNTTCSAWTCLHRSGMPRKTIAKGRLSTYILYINILWIFVVKRAILQRILKVGNAKNQLQRFQWCKFKC